MLTYFDEQITKMIIKVHIVKFGKNFFTVCCGTKGNVLTANYLWDRGEWSKMNHPYFFMTGTFNCVNLQIYLLYCTQLHNNEENFFTFFPNLYDFKIFARKSGNFSSNHGKQRIFKTLSKLLEKLQNILSKNLVLKKYLNFRKTCFPEKSL